MIDLTSGQVNVEQSDLERNSEGALERMLHVLASFRFGGQV
jgi:hypothetical protein